MQNFDKSATIKRKKKQHNFTIIDNEVYKDRLLSYQAMGLLSYLLSKPDDWKINITHLESVTTGTAKKTGRDGVYAIIRELLAAGFCERHKKPSGHIEYEVRDYQELKKPDTAKPDTAKPDTAKPDTAKPTLLSTDLLLNTDPILNTDLYKKMHNAELCLKNFEPLWAAGLAKTRRVESFKEFIQAAKRLKTTTKDLSLILCADIRKRIDAEQFGLTQLSLYNFIKNQRWNDELNISINGPQHAKFEDQTLFPEHLRISSESSPAVIKSIKAMQQEYLQSSRA